MLKNKLKQTRYILVLSFLNFILFHYPFFKYVFENLEYDSFNGVFTIISLVVLVLVLNFFMFYIFNSISRKFAKVLFIIFFNLSAVSVYFINTYGVIIEKNMIGNVFNTNFEESTSFLSFKMLLYILFLGVIPSVFIAKSKLERVGVKKFLKTFSISLGLIVAIVVANASNVLWIDKNSKQLGALVMPWSYTVNTIRYFSHKADENKKEILLPNATIKDSTKSVFILVIGESARSENFSLLGYQKNTNPLLSKVENLKVYNANSCATYTTAGVKCILEHEESSKLYEILPNYLYRNNVEVIWKSTNWGAPPIHIPNFKEKKDLVKQCEGDVCNYDGILLENLKEEISSSSKEKILIVLHTSTSHGPSYNKKYPKEFEVFTPVCSSVELANCTEDELINAYDNTIVYTDFLLNSIIEDLKELPEFKSAMLFVSDHGESLGENNLYMHGLPMGIAPEVQYEIPFILWTSDNSKALNTDQVLGQNYVFHSVLSFLGVDSPVYNKDLDVFAVE